MPTLRIQFPEKDSPSTLVLDAPKITLGRRADNTIQIVDRTISAFHAEFIREDDHYRIRDLGSTNGTLVDGEPVMDCHLREACKISIGPLECEFSPEPAQGAPVEMLPTRAEIDAIRRENEDLKSRIGTLQQEVESLRQTAAAGNDEAGVNALREETQRLIRERSELQEAAQKREREITSLKTELSRVNRDRQNLQDALSRANAEIASLRQPQEKEAPKPAETQPRHEPAASAPSAQTPLPKPAGLVGLPKPTSVAAVEAAPQAPAKPAVPVTPVATPRPVENPAPVARPAASAATPAPRVVAQPVAKAGATPRSVASPSGTQKISLPGQNAGGATPQPKPAPRPLGAVSVPVAAVAAPAMEEAGSTGDSQE